MINSPENKSHIPDAWTLTEWKEAESRRQLIAILEQIEGDEAEYLEYLDEYIQTIRNATLRMVSRVRELLRVHRPPSA